MKIKLKDHLFLIISLIILITFGVYTVVTQYNMQEINIQYNEKYLQECLGKCLVITQPLDTFTSFFNNIGNTELSMLGFFAPLFVIVPTVYYFIRLTRKSGVTNVLIREKYKKVMVKRYLHSLRATLILPLFLVMLFIFTYFQSGHFDIEYTISHNGETYVDVTNIENWKIFLPVFFLVIWLHSIFWANIGIISARYNKSVVIASIYGFLLYNIVFIVLEIFVGEFILSGSTISKYLSLGNIWLYYDVTYSGMILTALILVIISTTLLSIIYRNKEKLIKDWER